MLSYMFKKAEKKYQNPDSTSIEVFRNCFALEIVDEFAKTISKNTFETISKLIYSKY